MQQLRLWHYIQRGNCYNTVQIPANILTTVFTHLRFLHERKIHVCRVWHDDTWFGKSLEPIRRSCISFRNISNKNRSTTSFTDREDLRRFYLYIADLSRKDNLFARGRKSVKRLFSSYWNRGCRLHVTQDVCFSSRMKLRWE